MNGIDLGVAETEELGHATLADLMLPYQLERGLSFGQTAALQVSDGLSKLLGLACQRDELVVQLRQLPIRARQLLEIGPHRGGDIPQAALVVLDQRRR